MSADISIQELLTWPELEDVRNELNDPKYATRRHGSRATAALGCNGPLCKRAERIRSRRRNELRAKKAGRSYNPSRERLYDRDDLLEAIGGWHERELALRKLEATDV